MPIKVQSSSPETFSFYFFIYLILEKKNWACILVNRTQQAHSCQKLAMHQSSLLNETVVKNLIDVWLLLDIMCPKMYMHWIYLYVHAKQI